MSDESFVEFRQSNGRFAKGNPGGPGRPRARDRIEALDQRVAEAGPELIDAALTAAKAGNVRALEMLFNRIWPASRGRPVRIDTPEVGDTPHLLPVGTAVTKAVLSGDVTPQEGAAAVRVIEAHKKMFGTAELWRKMLELEKEGAAMRQEESQ